MTLAGILLAAALLGAQDDGALAIGGRLDFTGLLRDVRGNLWSFADLGADRARVLAFLGTGCPLANLYLPRLVALEAEYRARGVRFLAVYPNANEDLAQIAAHAADRDVPFLVWKDVDQRLADRVGAARTPTVVVLDGDGVLRYRGRIDDQYKVASRQEAPEHEELRDALDAVLDGREVATPEVPADGCLLDRTLALRGEGEVTWARDVAPIVAARCQDCHRPGQIGPFPLLTYEDVVKRQRMVREVVLDRRMPPWHADPRYGTFAHDRRLDAEEVARVVRWVDQGAPFGDEADLPPPREFGSDFQIADPDLVLESPEAVDVPATGVLDYIYQQTPTDWPEDVWVQEAEILPGDPGVLHHVLIYVQPPGTSDARRFSRTTLALVNWVPGAVCKVNPPGTATRIPKGSTLLWELHYTPNGRATTDHTRVALKLAAAAPVRETRFDLFANFGIRIPAGDPHAVAEASLRFTEDARLVSLRPHMHLRGKSWRYELVRADGTAETLLSVPNWDFNWQTEYFFAAPVAVAAGTTLRAVAVWDNSADNPLNPDPERAVRYGLQTDQEMMNGWVKYVPERTVAEGSSSVDIVANGMLDAFARRGFEGLDRDQDGLVSAEEWAADRRLRPWFESQGVELPLPADLDTFIGLFPATRRR